MNTECAGKAILHRQRQLEGERSCRYTQKRTALRRSLDEKDVYAKFQGSPIREEQG